MSDFAALLHAYPVSFILRQIPGLPLRTLNCWRAGDRQPPDWQKQLILEKLGPPPADYIVPPLREGRRARGRPRKPKTTL